MGRKSKSTTEFAKTRLALGLTQAEFADVLGVSRDTVLSIEVGRLRVSDKMTVRLARVTKEDVKAVLEKLVTKYRERIYREAGIPL